MTTSSYPHPPDTANDNMEVNNAFPFKVDLSSLPKLSSKGDNYAEWRAAWEIAFEFADLWDIVSGDAKKPVLVDPVTPEYTTAFKKWKKMNNKAILMILSAVQPENIVMVTSAPSAAHAWKTLGDRYDRDTTHSTMAAIRRIMSMRLTEDGDLIKHLDAFHNQWSQMERRCGTSDHEFAKCFHSMFSSDSIKGSFFLSTLPHSMNPIVEDLSTRDVTKFIDIEPKMLDVADQRQKQSLNDKAYYTKTMR